MEKILASKVVGSQCMPVTPLSFLRCMWTILHTVTTQTVNPILQTIPLHLLHQLEFLVCDSTTRKFRSCEIALAVLSLHLSHPSHTCLLSSLQHRCHIDSTRWSHVISEVSVVLQRYLSHTANLNRQRLQWNISHRTMRLLQPTANLQHNLENIQEEEFTDELTNKECTLTKAVSQYSLDSDDSGYCGSDLEVGNTETMWLSLSS